jgi:hypothetical protein
VTAARTRKSDAEQYSVFLQIWFALGCPIELVPAAILYVTSVARLGETVVGAPSGAAATLQQRIAASTEFAAFLHAVSTVAALPILESPQTMRLP